jgi:hypothetical protein
MGGGICKNSFLSGHGVTNLLNGTNLASILLKDGLFFKIFYIEYSLHHT